MKILPIVFAVSLISVFCGASFYAGLHWRSGRIRRQMEGATSAQVLCEANSLSNMVEVASLRDKGDDEEAEEMLTSGIKSSVAKLKALSPYADSKVRALIVDPLKEGEVYISRNK